MDYHDHYPAVLTAMTRHGLLLGTYDAMETPNVMTIGWGAIGNIWGVPVWIVLVRPSRHTTHNLSHSECFTVNVPTDSMGMTSAICGSRSGRDTDKFAKAQITPVRAKNVLAPVVDECPIVYECQIVHHTDVLPERLADEILSGAYQDGDYHRIYYGKILAAYADPLAEKILPK
jgi:flavin reductase (DIM6/NTAB) family NADH-FMN oxidoreductase RutF